LRTRVISMAAWPMRLLPSTNRWLPDVNYVGGARQLPRRVLPLPPPARAGGGDSEN
jgi:hypothetical protein